MNFNYFRSIVGLDCWKTSLRNGAIVFGMLIIAASVISSLPEPERGDVNMDELLAKIEKKYDYVAQNTNWFNQREYSLVINMTQGDPEKAIEIFNNPLYLLTDPYEIKNKSTLVITGTITDVSEQVKIIEERINFDGPSEPTLKVIRYTVEVDDVIKDKYTSKRIEIDTIIDSNLDFDIGTTVLFMLSEVNNEWTPVGGPHGMFKIKNDQAVGHEETLSFEDLKNS